MIGGVVRIGSAPPPKQLAPPPTFQVLDADFTPVDDEKPLEPTNILAVAEEPETVEEYERTFGGKRLVEAILFYAEDGTLLAPLPEIVKLCKKYGARLMVDDAHGIGVLGQTGRGTAEHFGLEKEVDIIMGTYSKSLASIGGFIAASEEVIHYIKHTSRPLIFSASSAPASVAAVIAALDIIDQEPERRAQLWHNTNRMMKALKQMGYDTGIAETPIIPLVIGEMEQTFMMWKALNDGGVFANPVVPPATTPGRCLIRTSYMATHTDEMLDRALGVFEKAGRKLGVIP